MTNGCHPQAGDAIATTTERRAEEERRARSDGENGQDEKAKPNDDTAADEMQGGRAKSGAPSYPV